MSNFNLGVWLAEAFAEIADEICLTCHADLDSAEHHAECVAPLDQLEEGA